jgi:Holliday junction resolvase RusA-like endonuclease
VTTVICLPFPPSTNNMFINGSKGRFRSQKYDEWIKEAGWELARQRPAKHVGPVTLSFEFQEGRDKRKRDISNLVKAPEDLLVKHGIIAADDGSIVREINLVWTPHVEGVHITISPVGSAAFPESIKDNAEVA